MIDEDKYRIIEISIGEGSQLTHLPLDCNNYVVGLLVELDPSASILIILVEGWITSLYFKILLDHTRF